MTSHPRSHDELPPRLAADAALYDRLVRQGCAGSEWELFAGRLYQKATRVTYRWLLEGRIFTESARIGRRVAPGDVLEWNSSDIRELAHDVVQETFTLFQKQLIDGKYDASRGASLFTYFMNAVARQFANVFRRTMNSRRSWNSKVDLRDDVDVYEQLNPSYQEEYTQYAALLFNLIGEIQSSRQRSAAWLSFIEGQSNEQIARRLDVSSDAARALVNRARSAMQRVYLQQKGKEEGRDRS
jgi:RNA polymerase sigma factor (sigma-70 family)